MSPRYDPSLLIIQKRNKKCGHISYIIKATSFDWKLQHQHTRLGIDSNPQWRNKIPYPLVQSSWHKWIHNFEHISINFMKDIPTSLLYIYIAGDAAQHYPAPVTQRYPELKIMYIYNRFASISIHFSRVCHSHQPSAPALQLCCRSMCRTRLTIVNLYKMVALSMEVMVVHITNRIIHLQWDVTISKRAEF
jgi:hypothetical protein